MHYPLSEKYNTPELMARIMGPNPLKLEEELLAGHQIPAGAVVCDLGSGQGLTSVFLAKEFGFMVYAADLWSNPEDNRRFFSEMGLSGDQIIPVKADAKALPFERAFFDAVISTDSYNYFGRDPDYLDAKLLPFVKPGGYIYIAVPGMKKDCHQNLPPELLLSWTPEQLDYIHDMQYWTDIVSRCKGAEIIDVSEMASNEEVWADWLKQENEYAVGDRKAFEAGGGKYLNFIRIVLRKKAQKVQPIEYRETKTFTAAELERLFLSVHWDSGRYPGKLVRAMQNSTHVVSAWDGDRLVGLVRALDDGETVAFLHYLLVDPAYQGRHIGAELMKRVLSHFESHLYVKIMPSDPATIPFYKKFGFKSYDNYSAMVIKHFN